MVEFTLTSSGPFDDFCMNAKELAEASNLLNILEAELPQLDWIFKNHPLGYRNFDGAGQVVIKLHLVEGPDPTWVSEGSILGFGAHLLIEDQKAASPVDAARRSLRVLEKKLSVMLEAVRLS